MITLEKNVYMVEQEDGIWAMLAGMATFGKHLQTAEVAYAAIDMSDKVQYINAIKVSLLFLLLSLSCTLGREEEGGCKGGVWTNLRRMLTTEEWWNLVSSMLHHVSKGLGGDEKGCHYLREA